MPRNRRHPFLTPDELAHRWSVNKKTVLAGISRGQIPCVKVGRVFNIPRAWVESQEDLEPAAASS